MTACSTSPLPAGWPAALRRACLEAGAAILAVREESASPAVRHKQDGTPVSVADRRASALIDAHLRALEPCLPVICEEAEHDPGAAERFWLVDPLDGTAEFLRGSDVFTVNVALVERGRPVFGIVHVPARGTSYWGGESLGAFRDEVPIAVRPLDRRAPRILVSPGSRNRGRRGGLDGLLERFPGAIVEPLAGALKFCRLAAGLADLYPRTTPCCAWDCAAGQAVLQAAGGAVLDARGAPLGYAYSPGWRMGQFLAVGDPRQDWPGMLRQA